VFANKDEFAYKVRGKRRTSVTVTAFCGRLRPGGKKVPIDKRRFVPVEREISV
jgi:hypothetical protein